MEDFDFDTTVENIPSKDIPSMDISSNEDFDTTVENPPSNEDDFDSNQNEQNILKQIDRKIVIKYMKEVKTSRTYIFGLNNYIKTKKDIEEFIKNIKKSLGTSVIEKEGETGPAYGFAGDHVKYLYDYIVKKKICPINEIKK